MSEHGGDRGPDGKFYQGIYFALPQYAGWCLGPYMRSVVDMVRSAEQSGFPYEMSFGSDSAVHRCRYYLTESFLASGCESLMFIDSDIEFEPEDVWKLWNLDADVAVGAYALKRDGAGLCVHTGGKMVGVDELGSDPVEVDYAGTGFMMIKRHVFEALRESLPEIQTVEGKQRRWWSFDVIDGVELPEDYGFCKRAREAGMKVVCDPSIRLKHWGIKGYVG